MHPSFTIAHVSVDVKRFIARAILLLLVVALICTTIVLALPSKASDFYLSLPQKEQLLVTTPSPRIIFVGGSSTAFGTDSDLIQQKLGTPVVNAALGIPLGLTFMLNQARTYMRTGDTIVIAPEYQLYYYDEVYPRERTSFWVVAELHPSTLRYFAPQQWLDGLTMLPLIAQVRLDDAFANWRATGNPAHVRNTQRYATNTHGDFIGHLNEKSHDLSKEPYFEETVTQFEMQRIDELNAFYADAQRVGARVFYLYPPISDVHFAQPAVHELIDSIDARLHANLKIPILSNTDRYVLPINVFYDMPMHLIAEGRRMRTERIIEDLQRALAG